MGWSAVAVAALRRAVLVVVARGLLRHDSNSFAGPNTEGTVPSQNSAAPTYFQPAPTAAATGETGGGQRGSEVIPTGTAIVREGCDCALRNLGKAKQRRATTTAEFAAWGRKTRNRSRAAAAASYNCARKALFLYFATRFRTPLWSYCPNARGAARFVCCFLVTDIALRATCSLETAARLGRRAGRRCWRSCAGVSACRLHRCDGGGLTWIWDTFQPPATDHEDQS